MGAENNIEIITSESGSHFTDIEINGKFSVVKNEQSIYADNEKVIKHIVLVVTRSANYHTSTPFLDVVTFKDDVKVGPGVVSGNFKIFLKDHLTFNGSGDYFVLCSLGTCLSNTLKISIL